MMGFALIGCFFFLLSMNSHTLAFMLPGSLSFALAFLSAKIEKDKILREYQDNIWWHQNQIKNYLSGRRGR